ncbi:Hypothetical protein NTJ_09964 [Nesidiocoris tenuis]|uniref:Uncharacterized protein n=1 Tax=Nesidiocoris tenuis TaxID=355587 RepID=A0ABN7AY84_9HEMI|nr:Hypothetical protein NTJ_09964 [Nesidiocoris tenuis]
MSQTASAPSDDAGLRRTILMPPVSAPQQQSWNHNSTVPQYILPAVHQMKNQSSNTTPFQKLTPQPLLYYPPACHGDYPGQPVILLPPQHPMGSKRKKCITWVFMCTALICCFISVNIFANVMTSPQKVF